MPRRDRCVLSVYRTSGLSDEEVWLLAERHLPGTKATAVVTPPHVRAAGLDVDPDNTPERHALITGWPPIPANGDQSARLLRAKRLAADAVLELPT